MAKDGKFIGVSIRGDKELKDKLAQLGYLAVPTAAMSLYGSAENIMSISKSRYCPVDTLTLQGSGRVDPAVIKGKRVSVTLGYGGPAAPYALAVHENPRAGKTGGTSPSGKKYKRWSAVGGWKYLETPVKENAGNVVSNLKRDLDRALIGLRGR